MRIPDFIWYLWKSWSLKMDQIPANPKVSICKGPKPEVNGSRRILLPMEEPVFSGQGHSLCSHCFGFRQPSIQGTSRRQPRHIQWTAKHIQWAAKTQPRHIEGTCNQDTTKENIRGTWNSCGTQAHPRNIKQLRNQGTSKELSKASILVESIDRRPQPKPTEQRGVAHHFGDGEPVQPAGYKLWADGASSSPGLEHPPVALFLRSCHCIFIH